MTCDALTQVTEGNDAEVPQGAPQFQVHDTLYSSVPWELKATFQSSNKPIAENVHWIRQIMAQCYVTGSTIAYLSRLEIMGNWKSIFGKKEEKSLPENRKPTLSAHRLEFTQHELDANWLWLKCRRALYEAVLETGKLVPKINAIPSGQEWECSWCAYKEECDAVL